MGKIILILQLTLLTSKMMGLPSRSLELCKLVRPDRHGAVKTKEVLIGLVNLSTLDRLLSLMTVMKV